MKDQDSAHPVERTGDMKRVRGWPRAGPPRRPPQRLSRDKRSWREEPVGLFAARTREQGFTFR